MGKFSDKFCGKSPFKRTSIGIGIHQDDPMERTRASEVTEEDVLRMREQNRRDKLFQNNITLASRTRRTPNINPAAFAKKSSFKNKAEREMYAEQKRTGKLPRQYRGL